MRILVVAGRLHPFATGGYVSLNYNIACFLSRFPYDQVTLWGTIPVSANVSLLGRTYPSSLHLSYLTTIGPSHGLVDTFASHAYFARKMTRSRFDVVHFGVWPGLRGAILLRAAKSRASKVVFLVPDIIPLGAKTYTNSAVGRLASWFNWGVLTRSLDLFDVMVCPSKFVLKTLLTLGFDGNKLTVLPLGVDIEKIQRIRPTAYQNPPLVVCAGPFMPVKGQHRLIEAFAKSRAKDYSRLLFIGSGTYSGEETKYRKYCMELAKKLALHNVQFMPTLPFNELIGIVKSATMCVVPSDYETFSQLTLEVMACGRPVLATKFGGIMEYVTSGANGILVDPKDTSGFADAIDSLFFNDRERERMGESALKTALQFDWSVIIAKYRALYQKMLIASNDSVPNR